MRPLVQLFEPALSAASFRALRRAVARIGQERLRRTYQTTFWFDLGRPTSVAEEAILELLDRLPTRRGVTGAEWWLSRMKTTDVQVDFHRDRDEKRALAGRGEVHPTFSSALFLNRARGGALAVTDQPPCDDNPARAPQRLSLDLVAPRPNRFALFDGRLAHGVLDANNQIPSGRLQGPARMRLALIVNWWPRRPMGVPEFAEATFYRALRKPTRRS